MSEKILIASGKGGVGKSTVTSFLGRTFAARGRKVLLVDSDTGLGALDIMLGVSEKVNNTWADVSAEVCDVKDAIIEVTENLHLLPSPRIFSQDIPDTVFRDILADTENDYDVIFIDAAAGVDENVRRGAVCCDRAIFVATADEISVRCAFSAAAEVASYGIDRENMRIIINRFMKKAALKSKLLNIDGVIDKSGIPLLGIIPEDEKITFVSVTNVLPKKKSSFVSAVNRIADRVEGKHVPLELKHI
ncbi:MAG: AAA family ATPase [Clostridia bacterium]|nr:AAA family ATPase [Clostridia bacterium]